MDKSEKAKRLKSMLTSVAPHGNVEEIPRPRGGGMHFEGLESLEGGFDTGASVDSALRKVQEGREQDLTASEMHALEAIVMPRERPVVFVRGGSYENIEHPWTHLNDEGPRSRLTPLLRSIGRIEVPGAPWVPYGGTGFVVGTNLLMTNRHVAALVAEGLGTRLRYQPGDAAVDFKREVDTPEGDRSAYFSVRSVLMIHPFWDMALLQTAGLEGYKPLSLSVRLPDELVGREVLAVGYPARDDRNDLALQDQIFSRKYNVKRAQPGTLRARMQVRSFRNLVNALTHDSSTLGGNSGSAILDVATGDVLGLHFAGEYLKANYAVPAYELARITVSIGEAVSDTAAAFGIAVQPKPGAVAITEAPMAVPKIFGGLEHRKGYQRGFLDLDGDDEVPVPKLTSLGESVVAKLEDGSHELKYHKFSVVMHKGRRVALFTAANVDWREESRLIDGRKPTREELTEIPDGAIEQWVTDWRIPDEHQLPDVFFTKDGGFFDKGHVVRRDDVAWGKPFRDMQKANGDTYHTTNCSPQTAEFNRPKASDEINNWGDLEVLMQKLTKADKAIVFAGPVLDDDDPLFEGRDNNGRTFVRVPRSFWKIMVVKGPNGPEAYGFVLEQDLSGLPAVEAVLNVPKRWRREMRPVEQIEELLHDLADLKWLKKHDQFEANESVRMAASAIVTT